MTALTLVAAGDVVSRLAGLVRPEFNVAVVRPEPDDPVLAGPRCTVGGCDRPGRARGLCAAHRSRWAAQGQPDLAAFRAAS